jgi:hypothetical protein
LPYRCSIVPLCMLADDEARGKRNTVSACRMTSLITWTQGNLERLRPPGVDAAAKDQARYLVNRMISNIQLAQTQRPAFLANDLDHLEARCIRACALCLQMCRSTLLALRTQLISMHSIRCMLILCTYSLCEAPFVK